MGFRDFCSQQSIHECEEHWTSFLIHMILQTLTFCTSPTRMTPSAPFRLTCFVTSLVLSLSSVSFPISSHSHYLFFFTGFSPKFQTRFFHLVSSTFQVTQHLLFPPKSTPCLQSPSQSLSVLLPSMELYMEHPFVLILKISKKAVFLSSLGKFPFLQES